MQPTDVLLSTLWVLVTLALALAGAALVLGVYLAREHKALDAEHGDVVATTNHALGMVKTAREVMTRMAVAAAATPEGAAALAAAAAREAPPPPPPVLAPVPQPALTPAALAMPEAALASSAEPAWSSRLADMHRRLDALLAAQERLMAVQQANAAPVAMPVPGGATAGQAAFISLPLVQPAAPGPAAAA